MGRSTGQTVIAALWEAQGHEPLLELLAAEPKARSHDLVHVLHEQSLDCRPSAPEHSAQLERVAGLLSEIHAGLRAAEEIGSVRELLRWQCEATWRLTAGMERLLAARAAASDSAQWPWEISRLPGLRAELDLLLDKARGLHELPASRRREQVEAEPRFGWSELHAWLVQRAGVGDSLAAGYGRLQLQLAAWQRLRTPGRVEEHSGAIRFEIAVLGELMELWHRLDPALDRTCMQLRAELVAGKRSLAEAVEAASAGVVEPVRSLHRRAYFLHHLLDQPSPSVRLSALDALAELVAAPEVATLGPVQRGIVGLRFATAVKLHWRLLPEPLPGLMAAVRVVQECLPPLLDGPAVRVTRDLLVLRARLLRLVAGWRDEELEPAIRAYEVALEHLERDPDPTLRGRTLSELASLLRGRRSGEPAAQDLRIRELYQEALGELADRVVIRARVLADFAVYLACPLTGRAPEDGELALRHAEQAAAVLDALPESIRAHPLVRAEEAITSLTLGNVRLEVGVAAAEAGREAAEASYLRGLSRLEDSDELLAGLLHLGLALVALAAAPGEQSDRLHVAREQLALAEPRLRALPVAHARAVAERALLAVQADPEDEPVLRWAIAEVEAALSRLPLGSDPVVRARVQYQLGDLYMLRDGPGDAARAAEQLAAARGALVDGGESRLAVEVARDFAESQIRLHADDGDPAALIRGELVLEQASHLAERCWAGRPAAASKGSTARLAAMLDGVYGDLAWLRAKLERPAELVLQAACRAKWFRPSPSLRDLRGRANRSSMLSPQYLDPLARRVTGPPRDVMRQLGSLGPSPAELRARVEAFGAANPGAVALDVSLTRWGTVVLSATEHGLAYASLPLTRETVRRWVWGDREAPGWVRQVAQDVERMETHARLLAELGRRLLEPALAALGMSVRDRVLLIAPGRVCGLPLGAAQVDGEPLVERVRGLALVASLADLPGSVLPSSKPGRALCVVDEPLAVAAAVTAERLRDVIRLLSSGGAEVEVVARIGESTAAAAIGPMSAKIRDRTVLADDLPSVSAVRSRVGAVDHVYSSGLQLAGLGIDSGPDRSGFPAPAWRPGSSLMVGDEVVGGVEPTVQWELVDALRRAGVGFIITPVGPVTGALAHDFSRSFYLYWALGRSIPEACTAALVKVAGSDPHRLGSFVVVMGSIDPGSSGGAG
ncbi:MAG: hypothetical protein AB1Z98_36410 [Nannocystaceae bacterium]